MSEGATPDSFVVQRLGAPDLQLMRAMNAMFGAAFSEPSTYIAAPPSDEYLRELLSKDHVIALAAVKGERVIGGLTAYELDKFEQQRREIYIYDLAVDADHRRRGVATALIEALRAIARMRGAWVIFVQGDYGDDAAIALYEKEGVREEVLHFDLRLGGGDGGQM